MEKAFERYSQIMSKVASNGRRNRKSYQQSRRLELRHDARFSGSLVDLAVTLTAECETLPYQGMDESCEIGVEQSLETNNEHLFSRYLNGNECISTVEIGFHLGCVTWS